MKTNNSLNIVTTQLRELYGGKEMKEHTENKIEPSYESMRRKFKDLYGNEPTFFIRVPYSQILLGDNFNKSCLFDDKLITNLEKDLIICAKERNDDIMNLNTYDVLSLSLQKSILDGSIDLNIDNFNNSKQSEFLFNGYLSYFDYIPSYNNIKVKKLIGLDILINCNMPNYNTDECHFNCFVAGILSSAYIHDKQKIKIMQTLFENCLNELSKIKDFFSKIDIYSFLYSKFFLNYNSVILYFKKNFTQFKIPHLTSILIADTLTPIPPIYYSQLNFENKRTAEILIGFSLILKRYKKTFLDEEILELSKNIKNFINYFENNLETIFELLDLYLKKDSYKIKDLSEELGSEFIRKLIKDVENYENILITKEFNLYKRLYFIFKEYERLNKISLTLNLMKEEFHIAECFKNLIIPMITQSHKEMFEFYENLSDEINILTKLINSFKQDFGVRLASPGWYGNILVLGDKKPIEELGEKILTHYETLEGRSDTVNYWISDLTENYCFWSNLGGRIYILDPAYEDFMCLKYDN